MRQLLIPPDRSADLDELRHRLRTQDNLATAYPLFCVQQEERIFGFDGDFADWDSPYVWVYADDHDVTYDSDADLLGEYPHHGLRLGAELEQADKIAWRERSVRLRWECEGEEGHHRYDRVFYLKRWAFVCAHFTHAAAQQYIDENAHNLTNPRVYATSQHRCHEWISVVEALRGT